MADFQQNFLASLSAGNQFGQQIKAQRDQQQLNRLAQLSYSAPQDQQQALLGQIAAISPRAAQQQEQAFASADERRNTTMVNMAKLLTSAPEQARPALWQRFIPTLSQFGLSDLPSEYNAQTAPVINQAAQSLVQAYGGASSQTPTDVRSFQMMTQGLSPEDVERARRINLGLAGRESSAAIGYQKVKGPDGVERLVAVDPRQIGAQVVGDGTGYGSFSQPAPISGGGNHFAAFSQLATEFPSVTMTSGVRSAERNAQVGGQPNSQHLNGTAADYAVPANQKPAFISRARQLGYQAIDEGDHIHLQVPRGAGGGANLFAGRRPEDEAAAVEAAKRRVELQYAPALQQIETQGAIDRAAGTAQVEASAERQKKNQTIMRDARETLSLLDQAETLLNTASGGSAQAARDSVLGAFNVSTEGAKATAGLNVLAAKLVGKVPRFEGPQSDKDVMLYRQAAGDLANPQLPVGTRMAALQTMRDLNTIYANSPQLGSPQAAPTRSNSAPQAAQPSNYSNLWN